MMPGISHSAIGENPDPELSGKPSNNMWAKFRKRKLPILLLVLGLGSWGLGLYLLCAKWARVDQHYLTSSIYLGYLSIDSGYVSHYDNRGSNSFLSIWLLGSGSFSIFSLLWFSRRFSLRTLLIMVFIVGVISAVPSIFPRNQTRKGFILVRDNVLNYFPNWGSGITDDEIDALVEKTRPEIAAQTLPPDLVRAFVIAPEKAIQEIKADRREFVNHYDSSGNKISNKKDLIFEITFREGLPDWERNTLFQFHVHHLTILIGEIYQGRVPKGKVIDVNVEPGLRTSTSGKWKSWSKEWEGLRKKSRK